MCLYLHLDVLPPLAADINVVERFSMHTPNVEHLLIALFFVVLLVAPIINN